VLAAVPLRRRRVAVRLLSASLQFSQGLVIERPPDRDRPDVNVLAAVSFVWCLITSTRQRSWRNRPTGRTSSSIMCCLSMIIAHWPLPPSS